MAFGKDLVNFVVTNADTLAASDNIGAWVRAGDDGDRISSTNVGGKEGLDVNVISEITVDLNGIYDVSTNPTPDNVGSVLFNRAATPALSDQVFTPTGGVASADAVVAANVHGADVNAFGMIFNGTTWDRVRGTGGSVNVNIASQSGTVTVSDAAIANTAILGTAKSVIDTEAAILAAQLANRKYFFYQNLSNKFVYIGPTGVTLDNGFRIGANSQIELRLGPALSLHAIGVDAGGQNTRALELS